MTACVQAAISGGDPRITLANASADSIVTDPSDAIAAYSLENDGDIVKSESSVPSDIGDWITPKLSVFIANYEVFATLNSGSITGGTTGSWLGLETTRSWSRSQTVVGASTAQLGLQIRRKGTTTVLATATITLNAQVD